jgi:hypothetical protein
MKKNDFKKIAKQNPMVEWDKVEKVQAEIRKLRRAGVTTSNAPLPQIPFATSPFGPADESDAYSPPIRFGTKDRVPSHQSSSRSTKSSISHT